MSASDIIKQVVSLGQENKTLQENLDKAMSKIHELEQKNSDLLMSQTAEMRIHELEEKVKKSVSVYKKQDRRWKHFKNLLAEGTQGKSFEELCDKFCWKTSAITDPEFERWVEVLFNVVSKTEKYGKCRRDEKVKELEEKVKQMTKTAEDESNVKCQYSSYLTAIEKVMKGAEHDDADGSLHFFTDEDVKWENIAKSLEDRFDDMKEWAGENQEKVREWCEFVDELEELHKSQRQAFKEKYDAMPDCPYY